MGTAFESINEPMQAFIERQHMFFVATAPSEGGRVNLSPKGYDSFRIVGPQQVCYLDLTGSGAETIAHVLDNGRITFMFCAFEGKPNIVRLYGKGRVIGRNDPEFDSFNASLDHPFDANAGARSIIVADLDRTSNACGYAVPFMEYQEDRERLNEHWSSRSADDVAEYWGKKNSSSIDGLPALIEPPRTTE